MSPVGRESSEMPWDAPLVTGIGGQWSRPGFVVMERGLRGRPSTQAAAGSSGPALRVLITAVTCLSNCAREACCRLLTAAAAPPPPALPCHLPLLTDDPPDLPGSGEGPGDISTHPHPPHTLAGGDSLGAAWLQGPGVEGVAPSARGGSRAQ